MTRICGLYSLALALCLSALTPAFADTFLVYSQGGIPEGNLFTWCDGGICDVSEPLSCDVDPVTAQVVAAPEGGNSLRVRTNVWGGWGVFPTEELDLSAYEGGDLRFFVKAPDAGVGPFNLKIEFKCVPDPVNNPAGDTYTTSIAEHRWDGTAAWQEIAIPVCEFFPEDTCDQQCLSTVTAPFMSTIEFLPFFNQYWIDYVRWQTPNSHDGPSSVQVQGRQLSVNGEPYVVNGVNYAPIAVGENWRAGWRDRPDRYLVDFPLIAASGANSVRLYAPLLTTAMLDAAWENGLHVIPTFGVDPVALTCAAGKASMQDQFVDMVQQWKNHPAILFWLIGNEVNANLGAADLCTDWYPQLDSMAQAAHTAEGASFHPVGTANADTPGLADVCQSGCSDDTTLPNVDLWGAQVYRGCFLSSTYADYQAKSDCNRPLVVTEFGVDAYDGVLEAENEALQASCLATQMDDAEQALAVRTPSGVSSGQVIFEWADEWWKADDVCGTGWEVHDGCTSFSNPSYPDPNINEEWWGLATQDPADPDARGLRTAYTTFADSLWQLGPVLNLDVMSHDTVTGDTSLAFDPAVGADDHTLYYGPLSSVSSHGYSASVPALGTSGSSSVTLPAGSLFFVVVGRTNGAEGCYGNDSACDERPPFSGASVPQSANRTCPQCP